MNKILSIILLLFIALTGKCQVITNYHYKLPYALTGNPYGITSNSAYTDAVAFPNGCKLINNGIYFGDENPPTDYYFELSINSGVSVYDTYQFTGLSSGTTYYYKQVAQNCFGTFSTPVYDFTTTATGSTPVVSTTTATSITYNSASTGGNVTNDGGSTVTSRGVYYSIYPAPISGTITGSGTGSYTTNLSSLLPNTKYYYRAFATNSTGTGYGTELNFTTSTNTAIPTVTTTTASSIKTNSAISGGNVITDGNSTVTERGVYYSTAPTPTTGTPGGTGLGSYSVNISFLSPNTTYYYRAYAKNSSGTGYGTELSFSTLNITGLATVTTATATSITTNSATLGGNVTADGGSTVTSKGVCYSTSPNPTTGSPAGTGTGSYTVNISYLSPGTTYYYRAFAINSTGTTYGAQYTFTTLIPSSAPVVSTLEATAITTTTAIAGGSISYNGNSGILESGVCYSTSSTPTTANSKVISGATSGGYYVMLSPLTPNTLYYYRAYARNAIGTGYGVIESFTTEASLSLPTVTVNSMTSASVTFATGGGAATDDGGTTVTGRGLVWNTTGNPSLFSYTGITSDGTGEGSFSSTLNNLNCGTTYYVKSYATNSVGTAYSDTEVSFTTTGAALSTINLMWQLTNKKSTAPAWVPASLDFNSEVGLDSACIYIAALYYSGSGSQIFEIEGILSQGTQLYIYNSATTCSSKSTVTDYYIYKVSGYPVKKVIVTNGIVTLLEDCQ